MRYTTSRHRMASKRFATRPATRTGASLTSHALDLPQNVLVQLQQLVCGSSAAKVHLMIDRSSVRLFVGLSQEEVTAVLASSVKRRFAASETIVEANQPANRLFLLQSGFVNYSILAGDGREILLRRLVPGNAFGVAAFLSGTAGYIGTAKAVGGSAVYVWNQSTVHRLAKSYPRLSENALRIVLRYIALYAERHVGLVSSSAEGRLANALTSLGSRSGHRHNSGLTVDIKNEELASLADVSLFTASRILKSWERQGAIKKSRGSVLIRVPEKLIV
jgi:CRP-like cAMP-binding protein